MSRMAAFTDGGRTVDRTNWSTTYISYYPFGGAIALALDLTLATGRTARVTLDDFMRAMWRAHGKPGGARPGYVDRPYTMADAEARLAEVSKDAGVRARLLRAVHPGPRSRRLRAPAAARRPRAPQDPPGPRLVGRPRISHDDGVVRLASAPAIDTPVYAAGLDLDDEIRQIDGSRIGSSAAYRCGDRPQEAGGSRGGRLRRPDRDREDRPGDPRREPRARAPARSSGPAARSRRIKRTLSETAGCELGVLYRVLTSQISACPHPHIPHPPHVSDRRADAEEDMERDRVRAVAEAQHLGRQRERGVGAGGDSRSRATTPSSRVPPRVSDVSTLGMPANAS